jgi:hypothetical protein
MSHNSSKVINSKVINRTEKIDEGRWGNKGYVIRELPEPLIEYIGS